MKTRNTRRFRLNGRTLALVVALPGMMTAQIACAEAKADTTTSSAQKATKSQKEDIILVTASPGSESATSTLKAPVSAGALGTASALDTPFSVSTVTEKDIQDKQISTLGELIASDPSVNYSTSPYTNNNAGGLSIRGINLSNQKIHINGMTTNTRIPELPPEMFDRIDVLKGATGFMYGFGEPGGLINYVTKKPTSDTLLNLTAGYKNQGVFSQHLDAGGRVGENDRFGYRINLLNEQGKPAMKDGKINRENVALSLDAKATDNLTFTADLLNGHRKIKNPTSQYFQTSGLKGHQLPTPVNFRNIVARLSDGSINTRTRFTQLGARLELGNDWNLQTNYFWNDDKTRFISPYTNILNNNGNYLMKVFDNNVHSRARGYNLILQGPWQTGFVEQNISTGVSETTSKMYRAADMMYKDVGQGNIHKNGIYINPRKTSYDMRLYTNIQERAVFASDRFVFNENWEFLAGIRHTSYKQHGVQGGKDYNKAVNTPTLALIFKPEANTSIYTSYIEALEQGGTVGPQYKNANETLSPLKSKQYEVGVKTDQNHWSATAALFRIERGAEYANADNVWVQDGEERYQGLELGGKVIISKNFDLSASTMWLNPTYRNVAPTKNIEGKTVSGTPRFKSAVELGWVPDGQPDLRTSLRWRHEGSASPDEQNNIHVPSHDLLDFFVNYDTDTLGTPVTARLGVTNLTDKKYWSASAGKNSIFVGEPRTFMANVTVHF